MKEGISLDDKVKSIWKKLDYKLHDILGFSVDLAILGTAYVAASRAVPKVVVDYGLKYIPSNWDENTLEMWVLTGIGFLTGKFIGKAFSGLYKRTKKKLQEHKKEFFNKEWRKTLYVGGALAAMYVVPYFLRNSSLLQNLDNKTINTVVDYVKNIDIGTTIKYGIPLAVGGTIVALRKLYRKKWQPKRRPKLRAAIAVALAIAVFGSCNIPTRDFIKTAYNTTIGAHFFQQWDLGLTSYENPLAAIADYKKFKKRLNDAGYGLEVKLGVTEETGVTFYRAFIDSNQKKAEAKRIGEELVENKVIPSYWLASKRTQKTLTLLSEKEIHQMKATIDGYTLAEFKWAIIPYILKVYEAKAKKPMHWEIANRLAKAMFVGAKANGLSVCDVVAQGVIESEFVYWAVGDKTVEIYIDGKAIPNQALGTHQCSKDNIIRYFKRLKQDHEKLKAYTQLGIAIPTRLPDWNALSYDYIELTTILGIEHMGDARKRYPNNKVDMFGAHRGGLGRPDPKYGKKVLDKVNEVEEHVMKKSAQNH